MNKVREKFRFSFGFQSLPGFCLYAVFFLSGNFTVVFAESREDSELRRFEFHEVQMSIPIRIVMYCESEPLAQKCARSGFGQFEKINAIMSDYDRSSEIHRIAAKNDARFSLPGNSENPVENGDSATDCDPWFPISEDLARVLKAARFYSEISDGAFEVSVSPLVQLWRRAKRQRRLPRESDLERAKNLVGSSLWELDEMERRIRLRKKGMRFDFGAIAKGYAIDRAFETIREQGVEILLIDAGGDMRLGEAPPEGWKIGAITSHDSNFPENPAEPLFRINTTRKAIATSGDTFQFLQLDGKRYSHIIDPRTGIPITDPCITLVIAETAMQADALASAINVLGPEKGMRLIDSWKDRVRTENGENFPQAFIVRKGDCPEYFYSENWSFPKIPGKEGNR